MNIGARARIAELEGERDELRSKYESAEAHVADLEAEGWIKDAMIKTLKDSAERDAAEWDRVYPEMEHLRGALELIEEGIGFISREHMSEYARQVLYSSKAESQKGCADCGRPVGDSRDLRTCPNPSHSSEETQSKWDDENWEAFLPEEAFYGYHRPRPITIEEAAKRDWS